MPGARRGSREPACDCAAHLRSSENGIILDEALLRRMRMNSFIQDDTPLFRDTGAQEDTGGCYNPDFKLSAGFNSLPNEDLSLLLNTMNSATPYNTIPLQPAV
jgi:hypothetical protein